MSLGTYQVTVLCLFKYTSIEFWDESIRPPFFEVSGGYRDTGKGNDKLNKDGRIPQSVSHMLDGSQISVSEKTDISLLCYYRV
jgi:hypothetical protein